jgi:hypothetical protein
MVTDIPERDRAPTGTRDTRTNNASDDRRAQHGSAPDLWVENVENHVENHAGDNARIKLFRSKDVNVRVDGCGQ